MVKPCRAMQSRSMSIFLLCNVFSFPTHGLVLSVKRSDNEQTIDGRIRCDTLRADFVWPSLFWQVADGYGLRTRRSLCTSLTAFREGIVHDMASATNSFARQLHDKLPAQTSHGISNMFSKFCCVVLWVTARPCTNMEHRPRPRNPQRQISRGNTACGKQYRSQGEYRCLTSMSAHHIYIIPGTMLHSSVQRIIDFQKGA